jgi:hypothetical protein
MTHPLEVKARPFIEISDSQVKLFQSCPRSWAFQKLLKIQPEEDRYNLYFGSGVHKGLERLHLGDDLAAAQNAARAACAKDAPQDGEMAEKAAAMVGGYGLHFYKMYLQNWETTAAEEWYEYFPDPLVKVRGSRDNKSRARLDPSHTGVFDFKTTAFKDGGDLGKNLKRNHQLALYAVSEMRLTGSWPSEYGLIFLQKPRSQDHRDWCQRALQDPSLYTMRNEPLTPEFAWYAMAVEEEMVVTGKQMHALARLFDLHGPAALEQALPNFNSCYEYGRECGFAKGCHSCKPIHRVMQGSV